MFEALRYYIRVDHKTRFRNNMVCVAVATLFYMLCYEEKYPEAFAVQTSLGVLIISFTISVLLYTFQNRNRESIVPTKKVADATNLQWSWQLLPQLSRRRILRSMAWILVLAFAGVGTPLLEAAIVDRRLRKVLQGELTKEKLDEAAEMAAEAREHNLKASPQLITLLGQKVLDESASQPHLQKLAIVAASQFASYRSSLQALPLRVTTITTLNATPTEPKGPPISLAIGCAEGRSGGKAQLHGIFGFGGFDLGNCSDVVVWPAKPVILHLDNLEGKNATFVNCTLTYNGGKLTLENVRFVNCIFQMPDTYARNQNVLQLLTAALTGQPIHLELTA